MRATLITTEVKTFTIHFDAILHKPTLYKHVDRLRHNQLNEMGLRAIELIPQRRPQKPDIKAKAVEIIVEQSRAPFMPRRDVLGISEIHNVRKRYIPAIAVLFRAWDQERFEVGFLIDGNRSDEHEVKFAATEASRRLSSEWSESNHIDEEVAAALATGAQIEAGTSASEIREAQQHLRAEIAKVEYSSENALEAEGLKTELNRLQDTLGAYNVRLLYMPDHPPLLEDALVNATDRVMIISPWITGEVVDDTFLLRLRQLLERGVLVYIGYGIKEEHTVKLKDRDKHARSRLHALSSEFSHFRFVRIGNTHAKVLIKDFEFVAISSFNWLSFKGDPNKPFRDEQGTLFQMKDLIDQKWADLLPQFGIPAPKASGN